VVSRSRLMSGHDTIDRVNSLEDLKVGIFETASMSEKDQSSPRSSPR
jgi:hypothetical protein